MYRLPTRRSLVGTAMTKCMSLKKNPYRGSRFYRCHRGSFVSEEYGIKKKKIKEK